MADHPAPGLLLLADSRLPTGGHAHSGGVEAAVERGLLRTEADLALFLDARLRGTGPVLAAVAAAGCLLAGGGCAALDEREAVDWSRWDAAVSARTPSAALRDASRTQGGTLLRTARRIWTSTALDELVAAGRPHHPLVLGVAAAVAGARPAAAALLALHHLVGGACSAAVRLLGLDPLAVAAVQARAVEAAAGPSREAVAAAASAVRADDTRLLPATGTPLPEILVELHARSEVTLFAS
jgi:urease accessory protein